LRRRAAEGTLLRLRRGIYVDSSEWQEAGEETRHAARIQAVALTRRDDAVFSHQSAALLWGLPILGRWPQEVHLAAFGRKGRQTKAGVVWHREHGPIDVVRLGELQVTSLRRTL